MTPPLPPEVDATDAFLQKLAALDLRAAQHTNTCLLDTTETKEVADLSRAYARCAHSLRQTLACHGKLKHEREKAAREAADHAASRPPARPPFDRHQFAIDYRVEDLRNGVDRVISRIADGDKALHTRMVHRFERELDDWVEAPDFLQLDVDAHILQACLRLGLPRDLAERWEDLPRPTFFPEPEQLDALDAEDDAPAEDPADDPATGVTNAAPASAEAPPAPQRYSG